MRRHFSGVKSLRPPQCLTPARARAPPCRAARQAGAPAWLRAAPAPAGRGTADGMRRKWALEMAQPFRSGCVCAVPTFQSGGRWASAAACAHRAADGHVDCLHSPGRRPTAAPTQAAPQFTVLAVKVCSLQAKVTAETAQVLCSKMALRWRTAPRPDCCYALLGTAAMTIKPISSAGGGNRRCCDTDRRELSNWRDRRAQPQHGGRYRATVASQLLL